MSRLLRIFMGMLLFAGCARVPESDLARTIDSPSLLVSQNEAIEKDFFETGAWPSEKWWEMFEDPQLNLLIERALRDNYTLKKAHAQVEYSHQVANRQRSKLFPELSGNYTEQWQYL